MLQLSSSFPCFRKSLSPLLLRCVLYCKVTIVDRLPFELAPLLLKFLFKEHFQRPHHASSGVNDFRPAFHLFQMIFHEGSDYAEFELLCNKVFSLEVREGKRLLSAISRGWLNEICSLSELEGVGRHLSRRAPWIWGACTHQSQF